MNGEIVKNNSNINHSAQPSEWGKKEEMNIAKKYIILILALLPFLGYSQQGGGLTTQKKNSNHTKLSFEHQKTVKYISGSPK